MLNKILFISLLAILFFSCEKPEDNIESKKPIVAEDCVPVSEITSTQDSFYLFYPGDQEFGFAKGIKINKEFEASTHIHYYRTELIGMLMNTRWYPDIKYSNADQIFIEGWKNTKESIGCYNLTSNKTSPDSLYGWYQLSHGDVVYSSYQLDMDSINRFEIIEYIPDSLKIKAKLSAHFVTNDYLEPLIPERVSFLNVEIEVQGVK